MMKKRVISCVLTAVLSASLLLTGCGGEAGTDQAAEPASTEAAENEGGSNGKVKLTALFVKHSLTKDLDEMQWLKDLEDQCGVDVEWQQISADWDQKKSAMFASGEIPDILIGATADSDYVQYKGLFEDMKPLIDQYAPNVQQMFKEVPNTEKIATTVDGQIYGIPSYKSIWPRSNGTTFINKKWLDAVGMEVPTTWDELEKVLIAFRDNDCNGNGDPTDEIPMDFAFGYTGGFGLIHLLGSTGMEVSKFAQRLFSEDLINKEAVTQDYSKFQALGRGENGYAKVGFTWGWESGDRFGTEVNDQYISVAPIAMDEETEPVAEYDSYALNYVTNRASMSSKCENKEAAMRFIDAFYDEKTSIEVLFGGMNDIDGCTKDNGDGSYSVLPPKDPSIDPGTWKWTNSFADSGPFYIRDGLKLELGTDMVRVLDEKSVYTPYLDRVDVENDVYPFQFIKYTQDDTNTLAMNQANINNITDQTWSGWLTDASRDIDAEWDAYVGSVKDAGLTQNLEIRQAAFDQYRSN